MRPKALNTVFTFLMVIVSVIHSYGGLKTAIQSGNFSSSQVWSPSGVPGSNDSVYIPAQKSININNNYTVQALNVETNGTVTMTGNKKLTIGNSLQVNGTFTMNNSTVKMNNGKSFILGAGSIFTFDPKTNDADTRSLFEKSIENFNPSSTLIIADWYDNQVPIGSVISGNFGNLELNSSQGSGICMWDQDNSFLIHEIKGKLTVGDAWIVLDKSGTSATTTIGSIELEGTNSYLDLHYQDISGACTLNTGSITVNGGIFSGINTGNGNSIINISGNCTLNGGEIIGQFNDGGATSGNGNSTFYIGGNFIQNGGSFYGIYNATNTLGGVSTIQINGNLSFHKGTFMATYNCHTGGDTTKLIVGGIADIDFDNGSSKFRICGMTKLGSVYNTGKAFWKNTGNVTLSGNNGGDFTTSASGGDEILQLQSDVLISSASFSCNWPSQSAASHNTVITIGGNYTCSGGNTCFSYYNGNLTLDITGNIIVSGGEVDFRKNDGVSNITIHGDFSQSSGDLNFHENNSYTTDAITMTVLGDFSQSGGTLEFDNSTSSNSAVHSLILKGANYSISGNGSITRKNVGNNTVFGNLIFDRTGTISFSRTGNNHGVEQTKQIIKNGSTLDITTGDLQVSCHNHADNDMLRIENGGVLKLHTHQVFGTGTGNGFGITVDAGGKIETENVNGLYNGTGNASLSSAKGLEFYLDPLSLIEYNGTSNQEVTGTGRGTATTNSQKYGILIINFQGTPSLTKTYLSSSSDVFVRQQLQLTQGELNLNSRTLTIENGATDGIIRTNGYINGENDNAVNNSIIAWQDISSGIHIFPFGYSSAEYLPVTFNVLSGTGNTISAATRGTALPDNQPWSGAGDVPAVTTMAGPSNPDMSVLSVIDRWWNFSADGITANVTITYRGAENTVSSALRYGQFGIQAWNGTNWSTIQGSGNGVTSGTGALTVNNTSTFGPWIAVTASTPLPIELIYFRAKLNGDIVDLSWATAAEINNNFFTVERSSDGRNFEPILTQQGAGNSSTNLYYTDSDPNPIQGYNYYRLKQTDFDGQYSYSEIQNVKYRTGVSEEDDGFEITSVGPNPFQDFFTVNFMLRKKAEVELRLLNSSGQVVFRDNIQSEDGINHYDFRAQAGLTKGMYYLVLVCDEQKISQKLIKN
ncbi:MAG: T9SS type A sorting domain-containing protein [Bacteroidia bacterium]|nr:T9SS type A sorting domain-containing protein [Bacteroidia bacterium]